MADVISLAGLYQSYLSDTETVTGLGVKSSKKKLTHSINTRLVLAGSARAGGQINMTGGTLTFDLTNLTALGSYSTTVNATGLQLLAWKFQAPSTNSVTNVVIVQQGQLPSFDLVSNANWALTFGPGEEEMKFTNKRGPIVGQPGKAFSIFGQAGDVLNFEMIFG